MKVINEESASSRHRALEKAKVNLLNRVEMIIRVVLKNTHSYVFVSRF